MSGLSGRGGSIHATGGAGKRFLRQPLAEHNCYLDRDATRQPAGAGGDSNRLERPGLLFFTPLPVSSGSGLSPATVVASLPAPLSASVTFVETTVEFAGSGPNPVSVSLIAPTVVPNLVGAAGTTAATPITVGVTGPNGPVSGVEVTLQSGGSGPSVACEPQSGSYAGLGTVLTNSIGVATCTPLFGGQIGTGTYTIYVGGSFATFGPAPLTVTAGPPALISTLAAITRRSIRV